MTSTRFQRARALAAAAAVAACVAVLPFRASTPAAAQQARAKTETTAFAGGCFWCMEGVFDHLPGVVSVTSGYIGGHTVNPTYEQVSEGGTGHAEAVQVVFDPSRISYARLLDAYWHNVDPVTPNAQFCDHGSQYRSAIFANGQEQLRQALASKAALEASHRFKQPIVTQVVTATRFYPAEEYHQHYYKKNPARYSYYRWSCGRDRRLHELWGDAAGGAH